MPKSTQEKLPQTVYTPEDVSRLLGEVVDKGQHGTRSNAVRCALRTHRRFLTGELIERSAVQLPITGTAT